MRDPNETAPCGSPPNELPAQFERGAGFKRSRIRMIRARFNKGWVRGCPATRYRLLLSLMVTSAVLAGCGREPTQPRPAPAGAAPRTDVTAAATTRSGTITIALDMQPNRPTDVRFAAHGKRLRGFVLDDDVTSALPNSQAFTGLKPGTYTVTHEALAGLTLLGITCESNPNGGSGIDNNTIDLANRSVTIQLEQDESVTCTFAGYLPIWENGDLTTYSQTSYGEADRDGGQLLNDNFFDVYTSGILEIGLPGVAGFSMRFTDPLSIFQYLPAAGTPGPLNADLIDPSSTISGLFGGEVLVLRLNIDLADADLLPASSATPFGDLTLCDMSATPTLNGLSVRDFSGLVNTLLGGGSNGYVISDLSGNLELLNISFEGGTPDQFAQDHLVSGACP